MRRVAIQYGSQVGWIYLRELRGEDEESISQTDTLSAVALLDRLLVAVRGAVFGPGDAGELTAADRDRLLANVYRAELGARVATTVTCSACKEPFDLDFELDALVGDLPRGLPGPIEIDGVAVRVPTGNDELGAAHSSDPRSALMDKIGAAGLPPDRVSQALREAAPLIDLELDAACPACGVTRVLRFSIQDYLLGSLVRERERRIAEVHRLARAYGWGLNEILSLPRARRRAYVDVAERELGLR